MIEEKAALRRRIREQLADIPQLELERSDQCIFEQVRSHPLCRDAQRLFLYCSVGREIDTRRLIRWAADQGKVVALPISEPNGQMEFYQYTGMLHPGRFGIPEPERWKKMIPQPGDPVLVPGLCFDRAGQRLGQGGGYYDRYLSKSEGVLVGLCRERFLVGQLPTEWNDFPVEIILTEKTVLSIK